MLKVEVMVAGKRALVDADQVKKLATKELHVARATDLQNMLKVEKEPMAKLLLDQRLCDVMAKIIRLNKTIRKNVQFIA